VSIADFAGETSLCERFMRRNGLCVRTKTTVAQKRPHLYVESEASSENSRADDFSGSDDNL
jgi:hypothetical protein